MLEWLQIGFGIGLGLILAVVAFALVVGTLDSLSVKLRWLLLRRERARKEA